ncbi:uncharacterized protein LOC125456619 isoform X2 [Stegostoma tigrinum]|nr:uncharacterized protein LOC125456619 isoform X2 [Stegostoma tigrinum]
MRPRYGPGRNCFKMADTLKKGGRGSRGLTLAIIPTWAGNQRQKGVGHLDEVGGFDTQRRNVHANGAGLGVLRAWFVSFRCDGQEGSTTPFLHQVAHENWYIHKDPHQLRQMHRRKHSLQVHSPGAETAIPRTVRNCRKLYTTQIAMESKLPSMNSVYTSACREKVANVIKDPSHPNNALFQLLPSSRRYRSLNTHTDRFKNSFFPAVIRLLDGPLSLQIMLVLLMLILLCAPPMQL